MASLKTTQWLLKKIRGWNWKKKYKIEKKRDWKKNSGGWIEKEKKIK